MRGGVPNRGFWIVEMTKGETAPAGVAGSTLDASERGRLVERTAELGQIELALARVHVGLGSCLLIRGPKGTGKSRLLDAAVAMARATGLPCWRGQGWSTWSGQPLLVLRETLGGARPGDLPEGRSPLLTAIQDAVARVPHLLAIDNFHAVDPATASAVAYLAEHIEQLPLLLVLSYQPELLPEWAGAFRRATTLELRPLTAAAVAEHAEDLLGAPPGPALRVALAEAEGLPLRVSLWLRDLAARQALVREAGAVDLRDPAERPGSMGDLALARRRQMSGEDAVDLMGPISVLGLRFQVEDLAAVVGQSPEAVETRLQRLLDLGAATRAPAGTGTVGSRWVVRWTGLMRDVYAALDPAERSRLHRACARVLERRSASPVLVAEHLLAASEPQDPERRHREAVVAARRGAAAVLHRAPETAAHLLREAAQLLPAGDPERDQALADLVEAELAAGDIRRARETGERTLREMPLGPARGRLEFTMLSAYELRTGFEDFAAGILSRPDVDDRLRRALLSRRAIERAAEWRLEGAEADAREVLREPPPPAEHQAAIATVGLAWLATIRGDPEETLRLLRDPERPLAGWGGGAGLASLREGSALCLLNRFDEALEVFYNSLRQLDRAGAPDRLRPLILAGIADAHYGQGAWDEALAEWAAVIAAPSSGVLPAGAKAVFMLAVVAAHRGDLEPARELRAERERAGRPIHAMELEPEAILLDAEGDSAAATRAMVEMWDLAMARGELQRPPFTVPWTIRFARRAGLSDAELAAIVAPMAGPLLELARQWPTDTVAGTAALVRGVRDRNAAALAQAAERYRHSSRASDHCLRLEVCGEELVRLGQRDLGLAALLEALDSYRALHATTRAEALVTRLRELGVGRGLRRPRRRPAAGWGSLTEEELTVAGLLSSGFSNPRIGRQMGLPEYRISLLVDAVLSKLGVASRLELALVVARRARDVRRTPDGASHVGGESPE